MNPQDSPSPPPSPPPSPLPDAPPQPPPSPLPNPSTRVPDTLSVTQPGERTLFVIRRHSIGILGVYVTSMLALIAVAVLAFVVVPDVLKGSSRSTALLIGTFAFIVVAAVCAAFSLIATKVYWDNTWTLTTDSITQVSRASLFRRQSSQLSLGNLEDVTAEQDGVLPHMLNYGVLRVETASESGKFVFPYCPNPNYYAQQVLAAREAFEQNQSRSAE